MIYSLILLAMQLVQDLLDVENPAVASRLMQQVFLRKTCMLVLTLLAVFAFLIARDNSHRLKRCQTNEQYMIIFERYQLLKM